MAALARVRSHSYQFEILDFGLGVFAKRLYQESQNNTNQSQFGIICSD